MDIDPTKTTIIIAPRKQGLTAMMHKLLEEYDKPISPGYPLRRADNKSSRCR